LGTGGGGEGGRKKTVGQQKRKKQEPRKIRKKKSNIRHRFTEVEHEPTGGVNRELRENQKQKGGGNGVKLVKKRRGLLSAGVITTKLKEKIRQRDGIRKATRCYWARERNNRSKAIWNNISHKRSMGGGGCTNTLEGRLTITTTGREGGGARNPAGDARRKWPTYDENQKIFTT